MDLHAAQIQGFFDVPVDHLYAAGVLNQHFLSLGIPPEDLVIVSPDEGSIKRALGHAERLGAKLAIVDKRRSSAEQTTQENIIGGPVEGRGGSRAARPLRGGQWPGAPRGCLHHAEVLQGRIGDELHRQL